MSASPVPALRDVPIRRSPHCLYGLVALVLLSICPRIGAGEAGAWEKVSSSYVQYGNWRTDRAGSIRFSHNQGFNGPYFKIDGNSSYSYKEFQRRRVGGGSEVRTLLHSRSGVMVERRSLIDSGSNRVRYFDTFTLDEKQKGAREIRVAYQFYFNNGIQHLTEVDGDGTWSQGQGRGLSRDAHALHMVGHNGLNAGLALCGVGSELRPIVRFTNNSTIEIEYRLRLEKGRSRSLMMVLYAIAGDLEGAVAHDTGVRLPDELAITSEERKRLVNFPLALPPRPAEQLSIPTPEKLLETLGYEHLPGERDLFLLGPGGKARGTLVVEGSIPLVARGAELEVPLAEIVAFRHRGRGVFEICTAASEVLVGEVADDATIAAELEHLGDQRYILADLPAGATVIRRAFEARPTADAIGYLALRGGEHLLLDDLPGTDLRVPTPWGLFDLPSTEIRELRFLGDPYPHYALLLRDRSLLPAFRAVQDLRLQAQSLGEITIPLGQVRHLISFAGQGRWETRSGAGEHWRDELDAKRDGCSHSGQLAEVLAALAEGIGVPLAVADNARIYAEVEVDMTFPGGTAADQLVHLSRRCNLVLEQSKEGFLLHDPEFYQRPQASGADSLVLTHEWSLTGSIAEDLPVFTDEGKPLPVPAIERIERKEGDDEYLYALGRDGVRHKVGIRGATIPITVAGNRLKVPVEMVATAIFVDRDGDGGEAE